MNLRKPALRPVREAGVAVARAVLDVRTVVGPASYAAGGIPVDLSATYSRIIAVMPLRGYTTATLASFFARLATPAEAGTDLYANGKFRLLIYNMGAHTHTYDKADSPTGLEGALTNIGESDPHSHVLTYTSTASGSISAASMGEAGAGTNLSALTFEFLVIGVPV